jgi:hypothetical protein
MPTADEQQALQLENAKADKQFYETLRAMHAQMVEERKALATMVEGDIAKSQSAMEDVADRAAAAKDRIARIERGEAVAGGLGKPAIKDLAKTLGLSRSEFRHMQRLAELGKASSRLSSKTCTDGKNRPRNEPRSPRSNAVGRNQAHMGIDRHARKAYQCST